MKTMNALILKKMLFIIIAVIMLLNAVLLSAEDEFKSVEKDDFMPLNSNDTAEISEIENKFDLIDALLNSNLIFIAAAGILGFLSFYFKKFRLRYVFMLASLVFLGFYIGGCSCSVGAVIKFFYEVLYSRTGLIITSLLIIVPVVLTLFFGRIFCGYVCPFGALQEIIAVKDKLFKISPKLDKKLRLIRIVLIILLITFTVITKENIMAKFGPFKAIFNLNGTVIQLVIAAIILLLSLFVYRPFCRFGCPLSLILETAGRFSIFKLNKANRNCNDCGVCRIKCPVNAIDEKNRIDNGLCIRCGKCIEVCKRPNQEVCFLNFRQKHL